MRYRCHRVLLLAIVVVVSLLFSPIVAMDTDGDGLLDLLDVPGFDPNASGTGDFAGWGIQDLDGANLLTNLHELHLNVNQITSLESGDFGALNNLQSLWLWDNQITSLENGDFGGLSNLHALGLGSNRITSLESGDFDGLANLQSLYLPGNQITSLDRGDFDGLVNLQSLWLLDNQITSIASDAWDGLTSLRDLALQANQITSIESGDFKGLNNLRSLALNGNQIPSIEGGDFDGLADLRSLALIGNQIASLESGDFDGLINLETLALTGNQITSLQSGDFDGLASLQSLYLHANQITSIERGVFDGLSDLRDLTLHQNGLSELDFTGVMFEKLEESTGIEFDGFWVDGDEISSLILDDAVLSLGAFHAIVGETNSITEVSLISLTFADQSPKDLGLLLEIDTLDSVTVDHGLFDSYADEFHSFAAKDGTMLTIVPYGDSNHDGDFNSADFVQVLLMGKYETGEVASWSQGDWNGDRIFSSADFVTAFVDGGYEEGLRTGTAEVPEPAAWLMLVTGLIGVAFGRRRQS